MPRNLVVCCDGTWNQFGLVNTNVVKLASALVRDPARQALFYDPGVGTIGRQSAGSKLRKLLKNLIDGAIATSLSENVSQAYAYLVDQYQPGDRIFIFGFSRGAYSARVLAALIHAFGIIGPGNDNLIPYIWGMLTKADISEPEEFFHIAAKFKKTFATPAPIHFVGVWDTVSSYGVFWDPKSIVYTARNPSIVHGRHAVAIDERRAFFRTNLWSRANDDQDLKQVWFAGAHCDVGGGYPDAESGLSQTALEWMFREAQACGLLVDEARKADVLGGRAPNVPPDFAGPIHNSLSGFWNILELIPKLTWDPATRSRKFKMNFWKPRPMPKDAVIHESVRLRMEKTGYAPPNLWGAQAIER